MMRMLETISEFEWCEMRNRFGDIIYEVPEIALVLVDIVRRERRH